MAGHTENGQEDLGEDDNVKWEQSDLPLGVMNDLPPAERGFVPELDIVVIVEKTVGPDAPNLVRRVLRKLEMDYNKIPVEKFPAFVKGLEEAMTPKYAKSIRVKMIKELNSLIEQNE